MAESAADRVYDTLKTRIMTLELPPGRQLTEGEVALELNMSKTPVREALARLRLEGLVTVVPRAGYRVKSMTLKEINDLFLLRALLEGEAAALSATRGPSAAAQLESLDDLCRSTYLEGKQGSPQAFVEANTRFHLRVAESAGNLQLVATLATILEKLDRVVHLGRRIAPGAVSEDLEHDHREIVTAIANGDPEAARATAVAHIDAVRQRALQAFMSSEDVLGLPIGPGSALPEPRSGPRAAAATAVHTVPRVVTRRRKRPLRSGD